MERCRVCGYAELIEAADAGDASAKWARDKLEIFDMLRTIEKLVELEEDKIEKLAYSWAEIMKREGRGPEDVGLKTENLKTVAMDIMRRTRNDYRFVK